GTGSVACRLKSPWACAWQNSVPTRNASTGPVAASSVRVSARAPSTEMADGCPCTAGQVSAVARMASRCRPSAGWRSSWECGIAVLVLGRDPARWGRCRSGAISAAEPEELDRDSVEVVEHEQGVRCRLRALDHLAVCDAAGVEMGDPVLEVFPGGQ